MPKKTAKKSAPKKTTKPFTFAEEVEAAARKIAGKGVVGRLPKYMANFAKAQYEEFYSSKQPLVARVIRSLGRRVLQTYDFVTDNAVDIYQLKDGSYWALHANGDWPVARLEPEERVGRTCWWGQALTYEEMEDADVQQTRYYFGDVPEVLASCTSLSEILDLLEFYDYEVAPRVMAKNADGAIVRGLSFLKQSGQCSVIVIEEETGRWTKASATSIVSRGWPPVTL